MDLLTDHLAEARRAAARGDWRASYQAFSHADAVGPMTLDDVDAFAVAAWRLGHAPEAARLAERVYDRLVRTDPPAASMKAVDVALQWFTRGDGNVGRGWLDRARRLLAGAPTTPTHGYLAYLDATSTMRGGPVGDVSAEVAAVQEVCGSIEDPSFASLSAVVQAVHALRGGRSDEGWAFADRALPAVESGDVPLEWAGDAYVLMLSAGGRFADDPRSRGWTASMARWCGAHTAVVYHRVLRLYRTSSETELLTEGSALAGVHGLAAGDGFVRLGEMRRQRGDADGARAADAWARRLGVV